MTDIIICFKSLIFLSIAWFTEFLIVSFTGLSIIAPEVREFFIETKEIINWIASVLVVILTIVRLRSARRTANKEQQELKDNNEKK